MAGKRIEDLDAYGSYDSDKMLSDEYEVSKNSGTSGSPIYASGGSRKIRFSTMITMIALAGAFIKSDGSVDFIDDQSMGGNFLTHVGGITDGTNQVLNVAARYLVDSSGFDIVDFADHSIGFGINTSAAFAYTKSDLLTTAHTYQYPDASGTLIIDTDLNAYIKKDGTITYTGDQSMGSNSLTHVASVTDTSGITAIVLVGGTTHKLYDKAGTNIVDFTDRGNGLGINTSNVSGNPFGYIKGDNLTVNRTYQLPDISGTIALSATTLSGYGITDAYTKTQIDGFITGIDWKTHVQVATTGNITLSGTQTIDGYAAQVGDRILVLAQSTATQNGIYLVASGSWTRTTDADTGTELISAAVYVEQGTLNGGKQFANSNTGTITIGTTNITFAQIAGAGTYSAATGLQLIGNQFSIDSTVATLTGAQALSNKTGLISQWTNDANYLANTLANTKIFVGNGSNAATGVTLSLNATSGSFALSNTGSLTMPDAATGVRGLLNAADWNIFNSKVSSQWITSVSDIYYASGGVLIGATGNPSAKIHTVDTGTSTPRGAIFDQYSTTGSSQMNGRVAGGTFASPTTVLTGRIASNFNTWAHDGTNFINNAAIRTTVVGTVGAGRTPSTMAFYTMTDVTTGVLTLALTVDQAQNILFANMTSGSVLFSGASGILTQNNNNFYFSSGLLSVNTGGDQTGTDSFNSYKMYDSFTPNLSDNGYGISHSHSIGTSPTFTPTQSLADEYIGPFAWYAYNGTSFPEVASIRGYIDGSMTTNRGARIEVWTKKDGGSLSKIGAWNQNTQFTATGSPIALATFTLTTGVTNSTSLITYASNVVLKSGDGITGTGIPTGTYVIQILSATSALLSAAATSSNIGLTFTVTPVLGQYIDNTTFAGSASYIGSAIYLNPIFTTTTGQLNRTLITNNTGISTSATSIESFSTTESHIRLNGGLTARAVVDFGIGRGGIASNQLAYASYNGGVIYSFNNTSFSLPAGINFSIGSATTAGTITGAGAGVNTNYTSIRLGVSTQSGGITHTSGTVNVVGIVGGLSNQDFVVSSGTGAINYFLINPTINQTGTASGTIIGVNYNPTVTSVLGTHYAWSSTAGDMLVGGTGRYFLNDGGTAQICLERTGTGIIRVGTGFSTLQVPATVSWSASAFLVGTGSFSINAAATATNGLNLVRNTAITAVSGAFTSINMTDTWTPTTASSATYQGIYLNQTINQGTGRTGANNALIDINPTVSSIITQLYGIRSRIVANPTGSGTVYNIFADGTAPNYFGGGMRYNYTSLSADTTLNSTYYYIDVDASGAARTITLPSAATVGAGFTYFIMKIDSSVNTVTVATTSSQTINGAANKVISTQYTVYRFYSDGANWKLA